MAGGLAALLGAHENQYGLGDRSGLSALLGSSQPYGARQDGTKKGMGFLGPLTTSNGQVMSELSFDFEHGGRNIFAPLIVPTLSRGELEHLLSGGSPTDAIYDKAAQHAIQRSTMGLPTFARPLEIYPLPKE